MQKHKLYNSRMFILKNKIKSRIILRKYRIVNLPIEKIYKRDIELSNQLENKLNLLHNNLQNQNKMDR